TDAWRAPAWPSSIAPARGVELAAFTASDDPVPAGLLVTAPAWPPGGAPHHAAPRAERHDRPQRRRRADRADRQHRAARADRQQRVLRPERPFGVLGHRRQLAIGPTGILIVQVARLAPRSIAQSVLRCPP